MNNNNKLKSFDSERSLEIIKNILGNIGEIMTLMKPLFNKVLQLEEAKEYINTENLGRAASLFGDISEQCRELESQPFSQDFLNDLKN